MESTFYDRSFEEQPNVTRFTIKNPLESKKKKNASKLDILWFVLKTIVFITCLGICVYQALEFYRLYFTYPLTTSITIITPELFKKPAITICNNSPFRREKFCADHPSFCQNPENLKEFCEEHDYYCKGKNITTLLIPKLGYYADDPSEELKEFLLHSYRNFTLDDSFFRHPFNRSDFKYLLVSDPAVTFMENGKLVRCHSENLHLASNNEPKFEKIDSNKNDRTQISYLLVRMRKDDIFFPWTGNQISFSIHSPFVPVNPLLEGILLKFGYEYNMYVRLEEEHLQPHPYETNCTDYDALWRKNNKTGPRSQEMCKAMCFLSYSRACYDCEIPEVTLYRPENLCSDQVQWASCKDENATERRDACKRNCKPACLKLKYHFSTVKIDRKESSISHWDYITIRVYVKDTEVTVLSHNPLYGSSEVFSYIGGLMGCWLGISVWTCFGMTRKKFGAVVKYMKISGKVQ